MSQSTREDGEVNGQNVPGPGDRDWAGWLRDAGTDQNELLNLYVLAERDPDPDQAKKLCATIASRFSWLKLMALYQDDFYQLLFLLKVSERHVTSDRMVDRIGQKFLTYWSELDQRPPWSTLVADFADDVEMLRVLYQLAKAFADDAVVQQIVTIGRKRAAEQSSPATDGPATIAAPADTLPPAAVNEPTPSASTAAARPVPARSAEPEPAPPATAGPAPAGRRPTPRPAPTTTATPTAVVAAADLAFTVDPGTELDDFLKALRERVPDATVEQAAAALAEWHTAFTVGGQPLRFVSSPGWTGVCLARWISRRYPGAAPEPEPVPEDSRVWELTTSSRILRVVGWVDPDMPPALGQQVTELDVNEQYVAAARSAELGDGEPTELDAAAVDAYEGGMLALTRCPGYLVLAATPDLSGCPGHIRGAFSEAAAGSILPTPLAALLVRDHKVTLAVAEAVIWGTENVRDQRTGATKKVRRFGRRLTKWSEVMTEGLAELDERCQGQPADHPAALARKVGKVVYTRFLGAFLRSPDHNPSGYLQPGWYDQNVATASANMLRALDKAVALGWTPMGGLKDSVWFTDATAKVSPSGMEISSMPGKWKHTRWGTVDDALVHAHATGYPQTLRDAVIAVNKHRQAGEAA